MTVEVSSAIPYTPPRAALVSGNRPVGEQLARLEARLLDEAGGDEVARRRVLTELGAARARFAGATVERFLPILVERAVRLRLRPPAHG
ncbi:three-helix bundle dimerization domain-containing protein [Blastococcus sp. URHD0036]|uniref:three-helix bundle dimerization domain-containing protein n=1 Tax=Blastococcus sp. URHD0036 TaxID=1380356 RepID=UPI0004960BBB|nr:hypothetical protein [Blastococcus sp. URHD0036]